MDITTIQAAEQLGVTDRQVRLLVETGELDARRVGGILLISNESLLRRLHARPGPGRPFAPRAAWGMLWELSAEHATWLGASERSRLRAWLRTVTPEQLALGARRRSMRHDLRILPRYLTDIAAADGVIAGGITAADAVGADIVGTDRAEIYCSAERLAELTRGYALTRRGELNLTIRVPRLSAVLAGRRSMPAGVVAVDLLDADDTRTRRAGRSLAEQLLTEIRR